MSLNLLSLSLHRRRAGFNPISLFSGEPGFFLDPYNTSTLFQDTNGTIPATAHNDPIRRVNDLSGNGNDATPSGAGDGAILQIVGSNYRLGMNGTDHGLVTPAIDFSGTDKVTLILGVAAAGDIAGAVVELTDNAASGNGLFYLYQGATASNLLRFQSKGTVAANADALTGGSTWTRVVTCEGDISGDISRLRINSVTQNTTTTDQGTGNYSNDVVHLGSRGGASQFLSGQYYGMICIGRALTSAEIASTEAWMAARTPVT